MVEGIGADHDIEAPFGEGQKFAIAAGDVKGVVVDPLGHRPRQHVGRKVKAPDDAFWEGVFQAPKQNTRAATHIEHSKVGAPERLDLPHHQAVSGSKEKPLEGAAIVYRRPPPILSAGAPLELTQTLLLRFAQ